MCVCVCVCVCVCELNLFLIYHRRCFKLYYLKNKRRVPNSNVHFYYLFLPFYCNNCFCYYHYYWVFTLNIIIVDCNNSGRVSVFIIIIIIIIIIWDINIQTDHLIPARRPVLIIINKKTTKKKRTCKIVDFAVPADHRIKLKECEKKDKYLDLARELKKTVEHAVENYTNCNSCVWNSN